MPYIAGGQLQQKQTMWRLSIITDTFWSFVNFVALFFQTMFQPDLTSRGRGYQSSYSTGNRPDAPGGNPRRRMGGVNRGSGGPSPPPMAGGG